MSERDLLEVDWGKIPVPVNDGAADHLPGVAIPPVALGATNGTTVVLGSQKGCVVVFAYPRTGEPGKASLVDNWDVIPGARGCTPQTCAFRDLYADLKAAGAQEVFGLSTQDTAYQREMVERLHVPFPVLSDSDFALTEALQLPAMTVARQKLLKRFTLIIDDGRITKLFYPVFPPDRNPADVLAWLTGASHSSDRRPAAGVVAQW